MRLQGEAALDFLRNGKLDVAGLVPWGSNYTFIVTICDGQRKGWAIYKPVRGERPLWDFPDRTLALREVAAYLVSEALGWPNVPPTVLRDGPQGIGMVQRYIEVVEGQHFFTLRDLYRDEMKRIALFDAVINNTDRKSGHVLLGEDGKIWCIDHGVTFHEHPKLRTVIWDFADQPIPAPLLQDLCQLRDQLRRAQSLEAALAKLLTPREMQALRDRINRLIETGVFPQPSDDWPPVPWPPI